MLPRIAFIDDEKNILETVKFLFEGDPYELHVFSDTFEALKVIREKEFALVIVELVMPQIKGTEVISEINKFQPFTKCMLMTGNIYLIKEKHSEEKVIAKPWNVCELKEIVRQSVNLFEGKNGNKKHHLC